MVQHDPVTGNTRKVKRAGPFEDPGYSMENYMNMLATVRNRSPQVFLVYFGLRSFRRVVTVVPLVLANGRLEIKQGSATDC